MNCDVMDRSYVVLSHVRSFQISVYDLCSNLSLL